MMVTTRKSAKWNSSHEWSQIKEYLTNVFVGKFMCQTNTLWLVLDRFAIYNGLAELLDYRFVDGIALCWSACCCYLIIYALK